MRAVVVRPMDEEDVPPAERASDATFLAAERESRDPVYDVPPGSTKFHTDVIACANEARAVAGDRTVMVHGADAAQALLQAGQVDEQEIHLVHVLLGAGRRWFEARDRNHIKLQLIRRLEGRPRDTPALDRRSLNELRAPVRGQVAVITGAGRGVGTAAAQQSAEACAAVAPTAHVDAVLGERIIGVRSPRRQAAYKPTGPQPRRSWNDP
jgi:hypothetical protein